MGMTQNYTTRKDRRLNRPCFHLPGLEPFRGYPIFDNHSQVIVSNCKTQDSEVFSRHMITTAIWGPSRYSHMTTIKDRHHPNWVLAILLTVGLSLGPLGCHPLRFRNPRSPSDSARPCYGAAAVWMKAAARWRPRRNRRELPFRWIGFGSRRVFVGSRLAYLIGPRFFVVLGCRFSRLFDDFGLGLLLVLRWLPWLVGSARVAGIEAQIQVLAI